MSFALLCKQVCAVPLRDIVKQYADQPEVAAWFAQWTEAPMLVRIDRRAVGGKCVTWRKFHRADAPPETLMDTMYTQNEEC